MSLSLITNYDNAANFTFDSNDIEVDANGARLLLKFFAQEDFSEDFADDTGFVYNSSLAEFTGGLVRQIDQSPTAQQLAIKYDVDINATWSKIGGLTPTVTGSPTVGSGVLTCSGAQGARYTTSVNLYQQGSVKFKYNPSYSGAPAQNINLVSIIQAAGAENNRIVLTHSPSGDNFRITFTEGSSNNVYVATIIGASNINLSSASTYEIELNWDGTAGIIRIFLDGNLHGTLSPGAFSLASNLMALDVGASASIYTTADASFDDVVLFNTVQHTASYTPGYTLLDFRYAETALTLPIFSYDGPGLLRPASPPTSTETGTPRYIIQGKYWDGDSWEDSDSSYAQATTKADILANIATFPSTGLSTVTVILVFGDSNSISTVSQIDFSVEGQGYETTNPTIRPNSFTQVDGLVDFDAEIPEPGSNAVRFIVERRSVQAGASTYFYWDGDSWEVADQSYAQSNTFSEINDNAASLDLSAGYYIRFVAFLHSDDSFSTPEIDSTTMTYDFYDPRPVGPNRVILYGWLANPALEGLSGTIFIDVLEPFIHTGFVIPTSQVSVPIGSNGYFEFDGDKKLVETATVGKTYKVTVTYTSPNSNPINSTITIPDQESVDISTLLTF
jgi:hypothetical protein